ncbi:FdhD protein [Sphingomonas jinjuensis]|uniref:Sulfur carrier protein FdhD n=1 Tax=Sphingomonas jinjuensis TaxID=535907 RepID=A0A840FBP1_9SPHN|nr:formate dehydrogenase accessory sulfurtransferase FdhD [Sphingomonas jinjuensis]MBB4153194.1 FdhD protein [Sphingomonas jinjuensis]
MDASTRLIFERLGADGCVEEVERSIALETPVAIEVNGIGYAVLMASPVDLEDLAWGFALSERLVTTADEIVECLIHPHDEGVLVRLTLVEGAAARAVERVRHRVSESSCGLCGIENLEQAIRPLPRAKAGYSGEMSAVFAALDALREHQPLHRATGAVHAAAAYGADGTIRLVREDVGRHNAFDKLIGAMLRAGDGWEGGFALLTSRCSYELVEKAALAGCPLLATISAPTALAVRRAEEAGVRLAVLARSDAVLLR